MFIFHPVPGDSQMSIIVVREREVRVSLYSKSESNFIQDKYLQKHLDTSSEYIKNLEI